MHNGTSTEYRGAPIVPGPYLAPEQTESHPLKYGSTRRHVKNFWSYFSTDDGTAGSICIIQSCFFTLSLVVSIALAVQIYYGDYQLVPHGSVATDNADCSTIGTDILKSGGNAVDAAVASTLCMGVVNPHVTGLGGGGFMLIYDHRKKEVIDSIDFREIAPAGFSNNFKEKLDLDNNGIFVGVPGLLRGLQLAHKLYGSLPWPRIVMPSVFIARNGFLVPTGLLTAKSYLSANRTDNLKLLNLLNSLEPGQILNMSNLAATLEVIAIKGADELYSGNLSLGILSSVQEAGGIMTQKDLADYKPIRRKALHSEFGGFNLYVPGPPSGGPFLLEVLKLLKDFNISDEFSELVHTVAASVKNTYQSFFGSWGDPDFNSTTENPSEIFPNGTFLDASGSHVAVMDFNDIYVSVISGLNTWYGSQILTDGGFVLNNALKNFNVQKNSAAPGKRPFSMSLPIIATQVNETCGHRFALGAGDATVALQLILQLFLHGGNVTSSMEAPRFRVDPFSDNFLYEAHHKPIFSNGTLTQLSLLQYKLLESKQPYTSCNLVGKVGDMFTSRSDSRGEGFASRF